MTLSSRAKNCLGQWARTTLAWPELNFFSSSRTNGLPSVLGVTSQRRSRHQQRIKHSILSPNPPISSPSLPSTPSAWRRKRAALPLRRTPFPLRSLLYITFALLLLSRRPCQMNAAFPICRFSLVMSPLHPLICQTGLSACALFSLPSPLPPLPPTVPIPSISSWLVLVSVYCAPRAHVLKDLLNLAQSQRIYSLNPNWSHAYSFLVMFGLRHPFVQVGVAPITSFNQGSSSLRDRMCAVPPTPPVAAAARGPVLGARPLRMCSSRHRQFNAPALLARCSVLSQP